MEICKHDFLAAYDAILSMMPCDDAYHAKEATDICWLGVLFQH